MRRDKPSRTAYKVAMNIVTLGAKPGMNKILPPGIVQATKKLLVAAGVAKERTVRWASSQRMVSVYEAFDWLMPGQFEAFAHRKAFCEQQVRDSIGNGTTQILVLGSGYDTMGWRLAPEFSDIDFFEIDHPATACRKAKAIEEIGSRPNLHLIAEDLGRHKLVDVMVDQKNWNQSASTTIIADGLLQYLPSQAVQDLFAQCASIADNSKIAFTYIPSREDGSPDAGPRTGLVLWLLKVGGEPWLWSIHPEALDPFIAASGWTSNSTPIGFDSEHGIELYAVATKAIDQEAAGGNINKAP